MSENRRQILDMLAQGKITSEEAERLLTALGSHGSASSNSAEPGVGKANAKYLRVVVEADEQSYGNGGVKVNVRIPMQLLRAGVKLASLIPVQARDQVNDALKEHGLQVDLTQLKPENLEELVDHLNELTVDVDDKSNKVRIFCE
jgi:hypothetical protein